MDDAAMTVAAFPRQRQLALGFQVKVRSPPNEIIDLLRGFPDHELDDGPIAQAAAGLQGILDVVFKAIFRRHDAGDAALSKTAVALLDLVLGDHEHVEVFRNLQSGPQSGDAGADHQNVGEQVRRLLRAELNQVAMGWHGDQRSEVRNQ